MSFTVRFRDRGGGPVLPGLPVELVIDRVSRARAQVGPDGVATFAIEPPASGAQVAVRVPERWDLEPPAQVARDPAR
jgi:hypothetical protein